VTLDRQSIEKKDFPVGQHGYDPAAVDAHLAGLADELEEFKQTARRRSETLASSASDQVRAIVEAAERTAAEIQSTAESEAREIREEADREAQSIRQRATDEAREAFGRVSDSTQAMLQRLDAMEGELTALIDSLRTGSDRLNSDLNALEGHVRDVGDTLQRPPRFEREQLQEPTAEPTYEPPAAEPSGASGFGSPASEPPTYEPPTYEPPTYEPPPAEAAGDSSGPPTYEPPTYEPPTYEPPADPGRGAEGTGSPTVPAESPDQDVPRHEAPGNGFAGAFAAEPATAEPGSGSGVPLGAETPTADSPSGESPGAASDDTEGARLIALNMALNGTPREETDRYLGENFQLPDRQGLLDEVYSSVED
jgi:cell division septum initiation protein DivIVA